jgi:hypothetical protein
VDVITIDDWGSFPSTPSTQPATAITSSQQSTQRMTGAGATPTTVSTPNNNTFAASFPDFDDFDSSPSLVPVKAVRTESQTSQPGAPSPQGSPRAPLPYSNTGGGSGSNVAANMLLPAAQASSIPRSVSAGSVTSSAAAISLLTTTSGAPSMALVKNPHLLPNGTLRAYLDSQGLMHGDVMDSDGAEGHQELVRRVQRATLAQLMHPELSATQSAEAAAAAERAAADFFFQPSTTPPPAASSGSRHTDDNSPPGMQTYIRQ